MEAEPQTSEDGFHPGADPSADDDSSVDEGDLQSWSGWDHGDDHHVLHVFAIQKELLRPLVNRLIAAGVVGAWLSACQELPGVRGLADIKRLHPSALPSWLALESTYNVLPYLEVRAGNHVVFNIASAADTRARTAEREAQLESFRRCRLQEGFASEGMLCNWPPLPLRVLDYLDAADLLSLSLVCKATHRASHYLLHREEEVLNRPDIRTLELQPTINSDPARRRAMRAASLMCGRPEAVDVTRRCPSLLHNLVADSDACTQPHVSWRNWWNEGGKGLTEILEARHVNWMGLGWTVDPEGWPSRDQGALAKLSGKKVRYLVSDHVGPSELHKAIFTVAESCVDKSVEDVGKVFEAALEHDHVAFVYKDFD